jgi:arylsulfatase A-like enzyme
MCSQRVIGTDFYPTFLAAAGLPLRPAQHLDGASLLPLLNPGGKLPDRPLVFHFPHYSGSTGPNSVLIESDWKLIRFYNDAAGKYLLYNLVNDPFEEHDLSASLPEKTRSLDERLTRLLADMKAQMPLKNPDFDPHGKKFSNRQTTLDRAEQQRRTFAAAAAGDHEVKQLRQQ